MPDIPSQASVAPAPPDWNPAQPQKVSEPTIWPAALALAVTLCLWGLASTLMITAIGVVLFVISLAHWIGDIRHERRTR